MGLGKVEAVIETQDPVRGPQAGARNDSSGGGARAMVASGIRDPQAYAQLIASHPEQRAEIVALLHSTFGNGFVTSVLELADKNARPDKKDDANANASPSPNGAGTQIQAGSVEAPKTGELSLQSEIQQGQRAIEFMGMVRQMLLPGYRRAVDELAPGPAIELATHIVSIVKSVSRVNETLAEVTKRGVGGAMVSLPGGPIDENPDLAAGRFAEVAGLSGAVGIELDSLTRELAIKLGPQVFHDKNVAGLTVSPAIGKDPGAYLSYEAGTTVELLGTIKQVQSLTGANGAQCPILDDAQREGAVALVEPWKGRPVNMAFLKAVLTDLGVWDEISATKGASGKSLAATANKSEAQGQITGALADVGEFDGEEAAKLLAESPADQLLDNLRGEGDVGAMTIFEKIAGASPSARGPLVRQLNGMGRLGTLCSHLPRKAVEDLINAVAPFDGEAAALLGAQIEGQGGGKSMHQIYMDQVDDNLKEDTTVDTINAYGWFLLDSLHNAFTAGFMHEYSAAYDAHEAGLISNNEFRSAATKALGKSAAILAVSAVTGGIAGEFASGVATPLVGEGAASVIGGGVGGFTAGISGHFTGDVYDQLLNGKEGFDSAGDYMKSGVLGGVMGSTTAMISTLSIQSTGMLRTSALRTADIYAKRFPGMTSAFERVRAAGANRGIQLKMTVSELGQLIKNGMGGPGGPGALQLAGGMDYSMLPPETPLSVRVSADESFNRPMEMSNNSENAGGNAGAGETNSSVNPSEKPALSIESVETEALAPPEGELSSPMTSEGTEPMYSEPRYSEGTDLNSPMSSQSPESTPATSTQPESTPATSTQPESTPATSTQPESTPATPKQTPEALMKSPEAARLAAKGMPERTINEIATNFGEPGLKAVDRLVADGVPTTSASKVVKTAQQLGVADEVIELINSGRLRHPAKLRSLLDDAVNEAKQGMHGKLNELAEAKARADGGKEVSLGGSKYDPAKPESGQADVIQYGSEPEALQIKTITGEKAESVIDPLDYAVDQIKGKHGETPPDGAKRIARAIIENPKNPLYNASRAELIDAFKARMQNLEPGDMIEIQVLNGKGEIVIPSQEIVP